MKFGAGLIFFKNCDIVEKLYLCVRSLMDRALGFAMLSNMAPRRMTGRTKHNKMYYVYIILLSNRQLYTGRTNDMKRRYREHQNGKVKSTKNRRPLKLIHYESYLIKSDAIRREKFLKTTEGKKLLK